MTMLPGGFGPAVSDPLALDHDDTVLGSVDGTDREITIAAHRGYRDASHFADVDAQVINDCESITGFTTSVATLNPPTGDIQLDPTTFTTGANSVKAQVWLARISPDSSFYWNAPSDIAIGDHVEAAFDLRTNALDLGSTLIKAFVASGVNKTGTVVYADDFTLQFPDDSAHQNQWYTIRIPLTGLTAVRSIGITQRVSGTGSAAQPFVWFDNIILREATGFDRAVYGAPPNSHIVIPAHYTTAKTQLPIFREPAGITWEDRRT